jgi:tRNA pseudouridine38-40 synthase
MVRAEDQLGLEVASRTDSGVHARANVLALTTDLTGTALLRALSGVAPDLWFDAAAPVAAEFKVRHAERRWYRYFEPRAGRSLKRMREGARLFCGEVDVRSFGQRLPTHRSVLRTVESVRIETSGPWWFVDIRAPSFVWGMVRKIITALRRFEAGTLPREAIASALRGERRLALPMAEPDHLVLWEVELGVPWTVWSTPSRRKQLEHFRSEISSASARAEILATLAPWAGPLPGPARTARSR